MTPVKAVAVQLVPAAAYAPATVVIDERADGVHMSDYSPASLLP